MAMFIRRVTFAPLPGEVLALRDALLARSTPENPVIVARRLTGEPQLIVNQMHTDLAAYEAWYKGFTPSPAVTSRISGLASALWEIRV
jgi:hypothetical protein